ncbi:MAG TPA: response regulator [Labilithrix sp.]|nr:response regulator [Labilithrix sp.]
MPVILVVDDMEDNRDLVAMVLDRSGYTVEVAVDGVDAVERARTVRPSIIVMDLAMPNMDGFDATRAIRAIPELGSVHIIAFSAFTDVVSVQRALAAGCNEVMAKPCTPDALVARVEAALPVGHARNTG